MAQSDLEHEDNFRELVGKKIADIRYLTAEEANKNMWYSRPLVIIFDDGSFMYPMQDDEGNNGGAMHFYDSKADKQKTIYVL